MFFLEINKAIKSAVLAGFFLFTSCIGTSIAQSTEQSFGKSGPSAAESEEYAP